jgi:NAD(P)-dependent dehydrogenase (short-subunit alcohol dehydrogenase family)
MNAFLSGGSRGLGLELVRWLAGQGWTVVTDARNAADLAEATDSIIGSGRVVGVAGDVSDQAHRTRLFEVVSGLGNLDLLINNASVLGPSPQPALSAYPLETLRAVYEVNVVAPLALIQLLGPLIPDPGGVVINVTSDAAVEGYEGWGGYGSSKAALEQISRILAVEHPGWRVYWVDPGDMNTRMHQEAYPGEDISDRPLPATSVPGLATLIKGAHPSGRYQARTVTDA